MLLVSIGCFLPCIFSERPITRVGKVDTPVAVDKETVSTVELPPLVAIARHGGRCSFAALCASDGCFGRKPEGVLRPLPLPVSVISGRVFLNRHRRMDPRVLLSRESRTTSSPVGPTS